MMIKKAATNNSTASTTTTTSSTTTASTATQNRARANPIKPRQPLRPNEVAPTVQPKVTIKNNSTAGLKRNVSYTRPDELKASTAKAAALTNKRLKLPKIASFAQPEWFSRMEMAIASERDAIREYDLIKNSPGFPGELKDMIDEIQNDEKDHTVLLTEAVARCTQKIFSKNTKELKEVPAMKTVKPSLSGYKEEDNDMYQNKLAESVEFVLEKTAKCTRKQAKKSMRRFKTIAADWKPGSRLPKDV